jgi:hypothetical protein
MSVNTAPIFPLTIIASALTFTSADTTTKKSIITAGAYGTRIDTAMACNDDSAAINVQLWLNNGSIDSLITTVLVPAGAGMSSSVKAVDLMNVTDLPWIGDAIYIPNGWVFKASCLATMTSGKTLWITAMGGNY